MSRRDIIVKQIDSKLRALLKGKSKLFQAYFYTGVNSSNQKEKQLLSNICSIGYKIISKEIIRRFGMPAPQDTRYKIQDTRYKRRK